jgi:5-methylthioribose kinase
MHRRIVGLAHIADFEGIENPGLRARCETKALKFGRCLVVDRRSIRDIAAVAALAERLEMEGAR